MGNCYIDKMLATGIAQEKTWVIANSVAVLPVPAKKVFIITEIIAKHFCDLAPGEDFTDFEACGKNSQHQLRVYSERGSSNFQWRSDFSRCFQVEGAAQVDTILPSGETRFNTFLLHTSDIRFEILKLRNFSAFTNNSGVIPSNSKGPVFSAPPLGYGNEANGGSQTTLSFQDATLGRRFQYKPLGEMAPSNGVSYNKPTQFLIPSYSSNFLNPPQWGIAFGNYTCPLINVKSVLINSLDELKNMGSL